MTQACEIIWPEDFDEMGEWEAEQRGLLDYVKIRLGNGSVYSVCFFTPHRIGLELELGRKHGEPCWAEPGLILVPAINRSEMNRAVEYLASRNYFSKYLRPDAD